MQEEAAKNLSDKKQSSEQKDILPYNMPHLEKLSGKTAVEHLAKIERDAYRAGENTGFAAGEKKALALIERLEVIIMEMLTLKERTIKELEPRLVELAVSIARKIILRELALKPETLVDITKEAIMRIERTGQITIKINHALYDLFINHKQELLSIHPDIIFDIDPSVSALGSVVQGPVEDVVTDVDEQIRDMIKDMGEKLARD